MATSLECVVISDTHGKHRSLTLPDGDVLIHCGDFCKYGRMSEVKDFVAWLTEQSHKHMIIIPGNHDKPAEKKRFECRQIFEDENINLLINEEVVIDGVKFWGSPVTPLFFDWHFMKNRGNQISKVWAQIPDDVDVLITHGPPYGHGDLAPAYQTGHPKVAGCLDLSNRIREIKNKTGSQHPRVHCFGHIHAGHGATQSDEFGSMMFINASTCDERYQPINSPIEFGITKRS